MSEVSALVKRFVFWYLRRCAGAFHFNPYGPGGRYVVVVTESEYHDLMAAR